MATHDDFKVAKLNDKNYYSWCMKMKAVLISRRLWSAINPGYGATMTTPEEQTNDSALSCIILAVEDCMLEQLESCTRAKEAWTKLELVNTKYGLLHALHVRRDLLNSKKTESVSMQDYTNDLKEKNRRLKNSGFAIDDRELALTILMGLPPVYDQLILHLEQNEESLTTDDVIRRLLLEEKRVTRREKEDVHVIQDAMKALKTHQSAKDHKNDRPQQQGKPLATKRHVKCFCCGKGGHIARECYSNPDSPNYKTPNRKNNEKRRDEDDDAGKTFEAKLTRTTNKPNIEYTALCVRTSEVKCSSLWYLDSAADEYMCNDIGKFENLKPCKRTVRVADDRVLEVKGTGTVKIKLHEQNGGRHLMMKNASYIPELTDNLLSVGKLTEAKITLTFKDDEVIAMRDGEVIFTGQRQGRMYRVYEDQAVANFTKSEDAALMHRRMGHISVKKTNSILKLQGKTKEILGSGICEVCIRGKMKKRPFPASVTKTSQPLQLVHTDVMGPIKPGSKGGAGFVVTFTDDYSRYSKVYFMKQKSEVTQLFMKYHKQSEAETGFKLKALRSDNGREYINTELNQYLVEEGIAHQLTVPYNPQQNGVAERLNQTLSNMARCLLIEGKLPKELWAEAVHTANYLRNRSPSSAIKDKVPIELWGKEETNYEGLKVFGCQAWRFIEKEKRGSKFDERARKCVFVGYPDGVKGFKVWDYEEDKFYISRDVRFEEEVFPFQTVLNDPQLESEPEEISFGLQSESEVLPELPVLPPCDNGAHETEGSKNSDTDKREEPVKHSQRIRKPKVCVTCDKNSEGHCNQVEHTDSPDPKTLREALTSPDAARWKHAMEEEINALEENYTWRIIQRPIGAHVIEGKWVYKKKKNEKNEVVGYKARLVARGFQQIPDLEFDEVYSPVVKLKSVRLILSIAAQRRWPVYHFDITSAYLNGILDKTVLMEIPQTELNKNVEEKWVCSLNKGLYGLKQGGRQWNQSIDEFLRKCNLIRAKSDPCVYSDHEGTLILALHVDDIVMTCKGEYLYEEFGEKLKKKYKSKDLGEVSHLLSMRVIRKVNGDITIDQSHLIEEMLRHYQMEDVKPASTPLDKGAKYKRNVKEKGWKGDTSIPYRQLLGSLMYLANSTRPDLSFATSYMSKFNDQFDAEHWTGVKHILRYLKKTKDLKLTYSASSEIMHGYCDADWGSDPHDRKSFGGYVFRLASGAVTWCSRKQRVTALSSTEAEFLQMVQATKEALWLKTFLKELKCENLTSTTMKVYCDNQGAIYMASNDIVTDRAKHIEIANFFIRDHVKEKAVEFVYVPTQKNVADVMTKILPKRGYEQFFSDVNLCQ